MFRDREDAARQLAAKLRDYELKAPLVLAIPRGGVITGAVLAREIGAHLKALAGDGITILLIEHHLDMVARLCDHVIVLAEGRRLAEGSSKLPKFRSKGACPSLNSTTRAINRCCS